MARIVISDDQSCPINNNIVDSYKISELVNWGLRQLATIGITGVYDLLTIDDKSEEPIEGWDVMVDILEDTFIRFEYWEPFVLKMMVTINNRDNEGLLFTDNFNLFITNQITRTGLMMVPRKIISVINTFQGTLRGLRYEPPYLYGTTYNGDIVINAICTRPYLIERKENGFTDKSQIWYVGKLHLPQLRRLKDLFLVNLGNYLIRLNENTQYPNMPIEQFNGLVNFISNLESKNLQDFEISHGYAPIYGK